MSSKLERKGFLELIFCMPQVCLFPAKPSFKSLFTSRTLALTAAFGDTLAASCFCSELVPKCESSDELSLSHPSLVRSLPL